MPHKISVACLIIYKNQLLMIKEMQNNFVTWDIPAGGIEKGEDLEESLKREILEEAKISIEKFELIRIFQFIEEAKTTLNFLYLSHLNNLPKDFYNNPNNEKLDEDILDINFFSLDEISKLINNNSCEHELAKQRLAIFKENNFKPSLTPIIVRK